MIKLRNVSVSAKEKIRFRSNEFLNKSVERGTAVRRFLLVEDEVCTFVQRRIHKSLLYRYGFQKSQAEVGDPAISLSFSQTL